MHKFKKHGLQEPPRKLCELCDFTCLTTGGLRFHQKAEHSGLKGPQEFKCALCDHIDRKHLGILKIFEYDKGDFYATIKGVFKHHEHLKHKKSFITCELYDYRASHAHYLKSHMQALCQAYYS